MKSLLNLLALLKVIGADEDKHQDDSVTDWDWVFHDDDEEDKLQIVRNVPVLKIYHQTFNC